MFSDGSFRLGSPVQETEGRLDGRLMQTDGHRIQLSPEVANHRWTCAEVVSFTSLVIFVVTDPENMMTVLHECIRSFPGLRWS